MGRRGLMVRLGLVVLVLTAAGSQGAARWLAAATDSTPAPAGMAAAKSGASAGGRGAAEAGGGAAAARVRTGAPRGPQAPGDQITAHDGQFWLGNTIVPLRGMNVAPMPIPNPDLTDADYARIQSWNMNFVRLHVRWADMEQNAPINVGGVWTHQYNAGLMARLVNQVALAQAHGQWVLIENYCGPPCFSDGYPAWLYQSAYNSHHTTYTDYDTANTDFWTDALQQQFLESYLTWLVVQLAPLSGIVGYEVQDEPARGTYDATHATTQMILDWQLHLAQLIRTLDPARVIFFTTRESAGAGILQADLSGWEALGNVAFDVHDFFGGRWGGGLNVGPDNPDFGEILQNQFDETIDHGAPPYLGTTVGQARWVQTFTQALAAGGIPVLIGEFTGQNGGVDEPNMMNMVGSMAWAFNVEHVAWAYEAYNGANSIMNRDGTVKAWATILSDAAADTTPDTQPPALMSMRMQDANGNGKVDRVALTFDEALAPYSAGTAPWALSGVPSGGSLASVSVSGTTVTLFLNEGAGGANTAVGSFTVALAANLNGVRDVAGNLSSFAATAPQDAAGPVVISISSVDGNGSVAAGDSIDVTFSEALGSIPAVTSISEYSPPSGNDTLTIAGLTNGAVDTGSASYVTGSQTTVTYASSTLAFVAGSGNATVRATVAGACTDSCSQVGSGSGALAFAPAPTITDPFGNATVGTFVTPSSFRLF